MKVIMTPTSSFVRILRVLIHIKYLIWCPAMERDLGVS